jgi:hypothetical protein
VAEVCSSRWATGGRPVRPRERAELGGAFVHGEMHTVAGLLRPSSTTAGSNRVYRTVRAVRYGTNGLPPDQPPRQRLHCETLRLR